ncbi:hypothetical protein HD554DRAFT_1187554 [Boletus coccyginus]|nr:hypothetical protein HD554DRAFT_1187554 [Boletus coccyginus]
MMPVGGQRRGMVLDKVGTRHGGSRAHSFDRASPHDWPRSSLVGDVCARACSLADVVDEEEKKHMGDDPAVVLRHQRIASSDTEGRDRGRTGYRQRTLGKLGVFCRERCKKLLSWRDCMVGGALAGVDGPDSKLEPGPGPGPGVGFGGGTLTLTRASAPLVGATGPVSLSAKTKTTGAAIGAGTRPELSRGRRVSMLGCPRPANASAWLAGPMSTSTPKQARSSGRLVKRRPKSLNAATAN